MSQSSRLRGARITYTDGTTWISDRESAALLGPPLPDFYDLADSLDWSCQVPGDGVRRYLLSQVTDHQSANAPGDAP